MNIVKRTVLAVVVNLLIIASFFVFVNCFQKQELWPVVVSGIFLLAFIVIKLSVVSKEGNRSQTKYYR
jgi:membrane protein YdbS with pleckstrin-like domain